MIGKVVNTHIPINPNIVPAIIPDIPTIAPSLKNISFISWLVAPSVLMSAISERLLMTVIKREEIMFKEATKMISKSTKKSASFSMSIAAKKFLFCSHHPSTIRPFKLCFRKNASIRFLSFCSSLEKI